MISVLIVDDSNDKVANVIRVMRETHQELDIDVVIDFITAQEKLLRRKYDLLVLDVHLPLRAGDAASFDTGQNLLNEINRKASLMSPLYILCITQFEESCPKVSDVWPLVNYSPNTIEWKKPVSSLLKHISKTGHGVASISPKPTIFVEGRSDEKILREAINIYRPRLLEVVTIKAEKSAGASWVARQIIAWAHSLKKSDHGYIRCAGVFDHDNAGIQAIAEVRRVIKNDSAEAKTFKILKYNQNYAKHLISIKKKGLDLPVTLEEMLPPVVWEFCVTQGWLQPRTNAESLLVDPQGWNKYEVSLKDFLNQLGLSQLESSYIQCVKDDCKDLLAAHISSLPNREKAVALSSFEPLILDLETYLLPQHS